MQTQVPFEQIVPAPQARPAPQWQPPAAQVLARVGSQVTHAAPPKPQVFIDGIAQVEPEQQPPGHVVALQSAHAPPAQMRPLQSWQAAPPLPQLVLLVPATQVVPEQQPPGHEMPSQTHAPDTHRCPLPQGTPVPHWQAPVAPQRSALTEEHVVQLPPTGPQLVSDSGVRHTPAAQQPFGHDKESQTQAPETQRWPLAHAAPAPHAQVPAVVQLSAVPVLHKEHAAPFAPQRKSDRDVHVIPSQQPDGHEVALQTHLPAVQRWPTAHAAPVPQAQVPPAAQPSARVASQPTQTAPPLPHVASDGALQVAPEQQPAGQLVALQPLQRPPPQV